MTFWRNNSSALYLIALYLKWFDSANAIDAIL